eukprot:4223262-Amphidinium_carterae.1
MMLERRKSNSHIRASASKGLAARALHHRPAFGHESASCAVKVPARDPIIDKGTLRQFFGLPLVARLQNRVEDHVRGHPHMCCGTAPTYLNIPRLLLLWASQTPSERAFASNISGDFQKSTPRQVAPQSVAQTGELEGAQVLLAANNAHLHLQRARDGKTNTQKA